MTLRILLLVGLLTSADAFAQDVRVQVELPLKTARSRDPVLGGTRDKAFFSVWIPEGVKTVRGGVCNPFSKDEPVSKHWQAACRHWQFAYVQTDFDAAKKEEFTLLKTALAELAKKSGHPEVEHLPLCFLGMSRGGGMSVQLAELMPERCIASVPVCLEVGPTTEAGRRIPMTTVFGEKDGAQMEKLLTKLPLARQDGARWSIAVQWNRKHEFGQANNLSFVFFDDVIARRLPAMDGKLKDIPLEDGWLGDVASWGKDGRRPTIQPWNDYKGDRNQACWFPSARSAATWQAFVAGTRDVILEAPAGLGDGQQFVAHSAAKPIPVKVAPAARLKPTKVEVWDADRKLGELAAAPWTLDVALQPGIHALYAVVHEAGQPERCSRPHTLVVME